MAYVEVGIPQLLLVVLEELDTTLEVADDGSELDMGLDIEFAVLVDDGTLLVDSTVEKDDGMLELVLLVVE